MITGQLDIFTVHENSLAVYREKVQPTLKGRKLEVLNAINELGGSATMYEVGIKMNRPIHTISGRFGELALMQLISDSGAKKEHHGSQFTVWDAV